MKEELYFNKVNEIPHITWGRTVESDEVKLFWTMSAVEVNALSGTLQVDIESRYSLYENWIDIEIDGEVTQHFMLPYGRNRVTIYRGMDRDHIRNVRVIRDTQAMHDDPDNSLTIYGFWSDGEYREVKKRNLRLEFVGDSLTTSEGLNGASGEMSWNSGCMNVPKGFPYLVTRELSAESRVISQSGWGVVSSWDGDRSRNIPSIYDMVAGVLSGQAADVSGAVKPYDFDSWRPDFIVINLGTNDCNENAGVRADDLRLGVTDFLKKVRAKNPGAYIYWAYGMCGQTGHPAIKGGLDDYISLTGDKRVEYLLLPDTRPGENGSREHPGPVSHKRVARVISDKISEVLRNKGL